MAIKNGLRLSLYLICICLSFSILSQQPQLNIVVNPSVGVHELTTGQIRRIFSMRQTSWQDQQPVIVYVLDNQHPTHKQFTTSVLHMFPYQLERIWNQLTYSGQGDRPITVNDEQQMLKMISEHPGAIGYLPFVPKDANVKSVKVIKE